MNNMIIQVGIIEDELPALNLLKGLLNDIYPTWEIITIGESIQEAKIWFQENNAPDLLFLDIQLSDGNVFSLLEQINIKSTVIFTTAFDEYALRAFEVNSIDYLLKPFTEERLKKGVEKWLKTINHQPIKHDTIQDLLKQLQSPSKSYRQRFLVSAGSKLITINVEDIAYFYSEDKISYAVTLDNIHYLINFPLNDIIEQLNPTHFFRVTRQLIISAAAVTKLEPYFQNKALIEVNPPFKNPIIVSRLKVSDLKNWLDS